MRALVLLCVLAAAAADVCDRDEVSLLHARQDQLAQGARHQLAPAANASQHQDHLANATGAPGSAKRFAKPKEANVLLELSSSVASRFGNYTGGLFMVMAFTFFAFLCSCTAILATRAFLQEQVHSGQLSQHERRQRLLQSLGSSVRDPKKELYSKEGQTGPPSMVAGLPSPRSQLSSPWRRIVIDTPLEGDKLGVNLTEDTLVIIAFTDQRAADLGFKVGERIVHVNGVPVFQQGDFQRVLSGAFRENHQTGKPIVVSTVEPASSFPNGMNLLPEMEDICGPWQLSNGEVFVISRLPGLQYLLMTMMVGGQPTASGLLMVQSIEELRCQLIRTDGSNCGDVRLGYKENAMEVRFSAALGTWGQPLMARRAGDVTPPATSTMVPPRPLASSPESLPPSTLP